VGVIDRGAHAEKAAICGGGQLAMQERRGGEHWKKGIDREVREKAGHGLLQESAKKDLKDRRPGAHEAVRRVRQGFSKGGSLHRVAAKEDEVEQAQPRTAPSLSTEGGMEQTAGTRRAT
ncbi:hypothetical protein GOP47_0010800, partial [Adiantum capillus-veneris]